MKNKLKKSVTIDVVEEKILDIEEAKIKILDKARIFEKHIATKIAFGNVFTKMTEGYIKTFDPKKGIEVFDIFDMSQKFLIAERDDLEIILFAGTTYANPFIFSIFIRSKRNRLMEPRPSSEDIFAQKLKYDCVCFYDLQSKHIRCEKVILMTDLKEQKIESILEEIRDMI